MAGRTPHEAVENYLDPLRKALSCVTQAGLSVSPNGHRPADTPHSLILNRGDPVRLRGSLDVLLTLSQQYRIVKAEGDRGPWKVSTAAYEYYILDSDGAEILAYHWHPAGSSHVTSPHMHLGKAARIGLEQLVKAHLPTARIAIEDVIRLLIRDFHVKPRFTDWEERLQGTQGQYEQWRTWSGSGPPAGE